MFPRCRVGVVGHHVCFTRTRSPVRTWYAIFSFLLTSVSARGCPCCGDHEWCLRPGRGAALAHSRAECSQAQARAGLQLSQNSLGHNQSRCLVGSAVFARGRTYSGGYRASSTLEGSRSGGLEGDGLGLQGRAGQEQEPESMAEGAIRHDINEVEACWVVGLHHKGSLLRKPAPQRARSHLTTKGYDHQITIHLHRNAPAQRSRRRAMAAWSTADIMPRRCPLAL